MKQFKKTLSSLDLPDEIYDELLHAHQSELREAELLRNLEEGRINLEKVQASYAYDPTGQDGESEIASAAERYIEAQRESYESRFCPTQLAEIEAGC